MAFITFISACITLFTLVESDTNFYVGSYMNYVSILNLNERGMITYVNSSFDPSIFSPSWLTLSHSHQFLYVVNEVSNFEGFYTGAIAAYEIDLNTHQLKFINQISSNGAYPCHTYVDETDSYFYISNYCSGTIEVVQIEDDGSLGKVVQVINHNSQTEEGCTSAKAHELVFDGKSVFAMDLGQDRIYHYIVNDLNGQLKIPDNKVPYISLGANTGPRHMILHPTFDLAFVISEAACTITVLSYDHMDKALSETPLQIISLLPEDVSTADMAAAELQFNKEGNMLYASTRDVSDPNLNRSCITSFSISMENRDQILRVEQYVSSLGVHPRYFTFDESNQYLLVANKNSDNIVVFQVDSTSRRIDENGVVYQFPNHVEQPSHLLWIPH